MAARSTPLWSEVRSAGIGNTGDTVADDVILRLSVYRDLNENGRVDFDDPRIATLRNISADEDGDASPDSTEFNNLDGNNTGNFNSSLSFALDGEVLAAGAGESSDVRRAALLHGRGGQHGHAR